MNFLFFPYICIKQQSRPALINSQDERALPVVDSHICPYHFVSLQEIRASFWRQYNTILNHTEVYHFEKGKLILHLRYDFESNKFCDTVGQKLRYYRQLKGYSTRQLADMVSVVPATITLYENDKHPIKYKTAVSIAEVLKIDRTLLLDDYTTFVDHPCNKLLQELRQKLNLNQSEIAAMIGVAPNSYSAWENASRTPRRQEYKNILPLLQKANITL